MDYSKNLLPIGSVVLLKGADKKIMITGRAQTCEDKFWDYASCPYPIGNLGPKSSIVFNREDIDRVYFIGFQDEDELALNGEMDEYIRQKRKEEIKDK